MASAGVIAEHLKEALNILAAYQFPISQRADLALVEIETATSLLEEWKGEALDFLEKYGQEDHDTSAKHI